MFDDAIRDVLIKDDRITYAVLFGSAARDRMTPFSDVDVAIGLVKGVQLSLRDMGGIIIDIEAAIQKDVDLVLLDEAPPALAFRIFRDGRVLFENDRAARVERQARAVIDYLDFEPIERMCAEGVLRAVADGR